MATQEGWEEAYRTGNTSWREKDGDIAEWVGNAGISSGNALDLGCGAGDQSIWLSENGFKVEGLDYSKEALAIAKSQNSAAHFIEWNLENLSEYTFENDFYDIIVIKHVLAYLEDKEKFLEVVKSKLRGVCILAAVLEHDTKPGAVIPKVELEELLNKYFVIQDTAKLLYREGVVAVSYYLKTK